MEIDSELYNNLNGAQFRDAEELLRQIKADGVTKASIIVDVGCGSGNVTEQLSKAIPHDRLVAFDIDPDMVTFAHTQVKDATLFVQDIGLPWEELNPILQSLEGQVDLVWSNRVLHWVRESERPVAAQNIYRLLAPGGRFYCNITYMANLNEFLPAEVREANEKIIKIPGAVEQEKGWVRVFKEAGLVSVTMEKFEKDWTYSSEQALTAEQHTVHYFRRYLPKSMHAEEAMAILERLNFGELWVRTLYSPLGKPPMKMEELGDMLKYFYLQFRLSAVKPSA